MKPIRGSRIAAIMLFTSAFAMLACGTTPTPTSGIGVPVASESWEVTIREAYTEAELLSAKTPGGQITWTPPEGFIFLVVDIHLRYLKPDQETRVSMRDAVIGMHGSEVESVGRVYSNGNACISKGARQVCITSGLRFGRDHGDEASTGFVFPVRDEVIDGRYELRFKFKDTPPIPFMVTLAAVPAPTPTATAYKQITRR